MVISLDFLTNREGKQCLWVQFSLYLLSTFQAWYSGYKNKLTTVPQEVDSVVAGCRPGARGRNDRKREPKFFKKKEKMGDGSKKIWNKHKQAGPVIAASSPGLLSPSWCSIPAPSKGSASSIQPRGVCYVFFLSPRQPHALSQL